MDGWKMLALAWYCKQEVESLFEKIQQRMKRIVKMEDADNEGDVITEKMQSERDGYQRR